MMLVRGFLAVGVLLVAGCHAAQSTSSVQDERSGLEAGWNNFRLSEFDLAQKKFDAELAKAAPGSDEQIGALFGLGNLWNLRRPGEDQPKAIGYFNEILKLAPNHDLAAWSLLALARMKHVVPVDETPDYDVVRKAYGEIIERFPGHLAAKEATIYYNATLVMTLEPGPTRAAISNLTAFVASGTKEFLQPAYSLMAVGYTTLKMPQERLDAERRSFENTEIDPANPFNEYAWAYWNIATIAEFETGDFELARQYYKRLIEEYPADSRVFPCREALARMDHVEQALRDGKDPTL